MSTTTHRHRTLTATALIAAALAALLSACTQSAPESTAKVDEAKPAARMIDASASEAIPEVVIVASREGPDSRG
jgi:type IV pilus biogenesis protein CpaD/CtpE